MSFLFISSILFLSIATLLAAERPGPNEASFRGIEDRSIVTMNQQNENLKQESLQAEGKLDAVYSIVTRNRTTRVKPGGQVEIDVFLSGYSFPERNKLYIQLSSPYILKKKNPGVLIFNIAFAVNEKTGKMQPVSGKKYQQTYPLKQDGATIVLNKGYFSEIPLQTEGKKASELEVGRVMSESTWDGEAPILLKMNMDKKSPSGDYDVTFTLTYGTEKNLRQDYKTVQFHISSWWERNQGWVATLGVLTALASLIIKAVFRILRDP